MRRFSFRLLLPALALTLSANLLPGTATLAQESGPLRGPGVSFELCPLLNAERAAQLLGQPVDRCRELPAGWVRQADYVSQTDAASMVSLIVADAGSAAEAVILADQRRTAADPARPAEEVANLGEQAFLVTGDGIQELVVRRGPYVVYASVLHTAAAPSAADLTPLVEPVLAAL